MLEQLSSEIAELGRHVAAATAIVTGQTRDFSEASGSAWLFDSRHLVTNFHVVDGLTRPIRIRTPGHPQIVVSVLATDPLTDLAVLEMPEPMADQLKLRDSAARLGELCFAFGSPLGDYPESMTIGVVSGLNRRITSPGGRMIEGVIQTDAAINYGNSGGPLIDASGLVLGVNTQGIDAADNIGFAVPADTVRDIVTELLEYHEVRRPSLGLSVAPTFTAVNGQEQERLQIIAVSPNPTGAFQPGDVLLRINEHEVRTRADLLRVLRKDLIGVVTLVEVARNDAVITLECRPTKLSDG